VAALAAAIEAAVDLEAVLAIARSAPPLAATPWDPVAALGDPPRRPGRPPMVCVAGGAAFTFGYPEHLELLEAAGAQVVVVDPVRDERLPAGADALIIGGGFPEVHVSALAGNEMLRAEVAALAARAPVAAECAGLLYLAESLAGEPMCGVVPADAVMSETLTLGYREAVAPTSSVLTEAGARVHGHEFHRTVCRFRGASRRAWTWPPEQGEGFVSGRVHASYLHLHWAGRPAIARRFTEAAYAAGVRSARKGQA
jgi:cobyrinic acid a,c-diamide synthase